MLVSPNVGAIAHLISTPPNFPLRQESDNISGFFDISARK